MKYFLRILLVLVLAAAVVFWAYCFTNGNPFENRTATQLTTVTKPAATEKNSDRVLLAALEEEDFRLYKTGNMVVLVHGKQETEFNNWSRRIDAQTPQMYYADFDGDKTKELLVRVVSSELTDSGDYLYDLYLLRPLKSDANEPVYEVLQASSTLISDILNNRIRKELSQLKNCKKILQFAMASSNKSITYDKDTGLAEEKAYTSYFRALQNADGDYLTMEKWEKGESIISVNDSNKIQVTTAIRVLYKNTQTVQNAGLLYFELSATDKGFSITNRSMVFKPAKEYCVSNPRTTAQESWSFSENNADKTVDGIDTNINWLQYTPLYSSDVYEQTLYFATDNTDNNALLRATITENGAELTAKSGCHFDKDALQKREYAVVINSGTDDEYEISYLASVMEVNGLEVLKIGFDKAYPQSEIQSITIRFGSK